MSVAECEVTDEAIARRAYELWESRGCPEGDGSEDWEAAKRELRGENDRSEGGLLSWWSRIRSRDNIRDN